MKPTDEQAREVAKMSYCVPCVAYHIIVAWEKIRPADPALELPEWIPVSERLPTEDDSDKDGEVLWYVDGCVATQNYEDSHPSTHWLPISVIAALPKRNPLKKEDRDAAEFEAWKAKRYHEPLLSARDVEILKEAWMAARKEAGK